MHGESSQETLAFVHIKEDVTAEALLVQMEKVRLKRRMYGYMYR